MQGVDQRRYHCLAQASCGACPWIEVPYGEQLARKQAALAELFGQWCEPLPIVPCDEPVNCRSKIVVPAYPTKDKRSFHGAYDGGVVNRGAGRACCLMDEQLRPVFDALLDLMHPAATLEANPPEVLERPIRHVVLRSSQSNRQIMVTFVCNWPCLSASSPAIRELLRRCPQITTLVMNINHGQVSDQYGEHNIILAGPGYIDDALCGCTFRISPRSFYQINPKQTEVFYNAAIEMAALRTGETALDAYCGTGTIGIAAVARVSGGAQLIGVETNEQAVDDARVNARLNSAPDARFIVGDATQCLRELSASDTRPDVVFMDPPRKGASPEFLDALCACQPSRAVYISCNPTTQARDIALLGERGWRLERLQPVDVFPHSPHVESVALLIHRA